MDIRRGFDIPSTAEMQAAHLRAEIKQLREVAVRLQNRVLELKREILDLQELAGERQIERLRTALEFYADESSWRADGAIQSPGANPLLESPAAMDRGHRARVILGHDNECGCGIPGCTLGYS